MNSLNFVENSILDLSKKFISRSQTYSSNTSDSDPPIPSSGRGSPITLQDIDIKVHPKNDNTVSPVSNDSTNAGHLSNIQNSLMKSDYYVSDFQLNNGDSIKARPSSQDGCDSFAVSVLNKFGKNLAASDMCFSHLSPESSTEPNKFSIRMLPHRKRPIISMAVKEDVSVDAMQDKKSKDNFTEVPSSSYNSENVDDAQDSSNSSRSFTFSNYNNSPETMSENLDFFCQKNILHGQEIRPDAYSMSDDCKAKQSSRTRGGQLKDEAYWERRRKNNEAAKRSRDTRRQKEEETAYKARCLAQENISLKAEINILRNQLCNIQSMLFHRSNTHALM